MDVDHIVAAALPISGLSAWQGLFDHGRLTTGQTVLIHGAAGGVGSIAVQLAREVGARVIGTGRAGDRGWAWELGVILPRPGHRKAGGRRGSRRGVRRDRRRHPRPFGGTGARRWNARHHRRTAADPAARRAGTFLRCRTDRARLADLAAPVRVGAQAVVAVPLAEAAAAFAPDKRVAGKTILRVAED